MCPAQRAATAESKETFSCPAGTCLPAPLTPTAPVTLIQGQREPSCCHDSPLSRKLQETAPEPSAFQVPLIYRFTSFSLLRNRGGPSASSQGASVSCISSKHRHKDSPERPKTSAHPKAILNPEERFGIGWDHVYPQAVG